MATKFQIKRTTVAGNLPDVANTEDSAFIDVGELAINVNDRILYSTDGTTLFEVGANVSSLQINDYTLPSADGTANQILQTNGNGTVSFTDVSVTAEDGLLDINAGTEIDLTITGGDFTANKSTETDIIINHADVTRSDPAAGDNTLANEGTFTAISSVTTNARGHITAVQANNFTLPTGVTNLTATANDTALEITSSTGTNASIPAANTSAWGAMTDEQATKLDGIETGATADQTQADINALVITEVGTITTGTWNGSVIASAYLDSDTAHLSGTQTFSGAKTFSAGITTDTITGSTITSTINFDDDASGNGSNATSIKSLAGVNLYFDTNDNDTSTFKIFHASTEVAQFDASGNLTLTGTVDGVDIAALNTTVGGKQDALTFGIADTNTVVVDDADAADNDYAKFTANGLEGRSATEVKTDLSLNNVENTALSTWAGSTNITTLGTIATGTWQGTAIDTAYISNLSGTNTGDEPDASATVKGIVELATVTEVNTGTDTVRAVTPAGVAGFTGSANVVTVGTISSGTWQGTAIASAYLDADTAHLTGAQDFTGAKTFSGGVVASGGISGLTLTDGISGTNFNIEGVNVLSISDPGEGIVFGGGASGNMTLAIIDDTTDNILRYSGTGAVFDVQGNITLTGTVDGVDIAALNTTVGGKQDALTFGIADTNTVVVDDADAADNDYAKFTANGLEGRSASEVKTDLSLNNVENTALSTFAGTSNITTLGTIATGTWNGSVITSAYLDADTAHLSGTQTFTGQKNFNTSTNGIPLNISRSGSDASQVLSIGITDTTAEFNYIEDTTAEGTGAYGSYVFKVSGNEVTSPTTTVLTLDEGVATFAGNVTGNNLSGTNTGDETQSSINSLAITEVGTITSGTWTATDVAVAHGGTGASDAATARTNLGLAIGTNVQAYNATLAAVAGGTYTGDDSITTVGTIGTGTWQGTAIASAYLDADTAHLSGTQTFSGAKTFGGNVQTYTLKVQATDTAGAPATAPEIEMTGYEGRGQGIRYKDTSFSGEEWFSGIRYSSSFNDWIVGYDEAGGQSEYDANVIFKVNSAGIVDVTGEVRASGDVTAFYSSDSRLKENVRNISDPINKVKLLNGYNFDWTDSHLESRGGVDGYHVRKEDVGVIAQELQNVLPELVAEREDGLLAVKYDRIVALLIEAVKEQQKQIDELKTINS